MVHLIGLQNELSILEFIHNVVETFDRYFESVVSPPTNCFEDAILIHTFFSLQCELDVSLHEFHK